MPAPILDAAYMHRRQNAQNQQRAAAFMDALGALKGQLGGDYVPPDPIHEAQEAYATGRIDLGEFSARVEVALRGRR